VCPTDLKAHYTAVVVGAGPGGSTAARVLAEGGVDVLLLEKSKDVGKNFLCAEGISRQSLTAFYPPDPRYVATEIHEIRMVGPDGTDFTIRAPHAGYVLERVIFDRFLAEEAARAGAELRTGATFKEIRREGRRFRLSVLYDGRLQEVTADLVIGADGPASRVGTQLGLAVQTEERDIHFASQVLLVHPSIRANRMEFFVSYDLAPYGYGWVFPKRDGVGNVGLGVLPPHRSQEFLERMLSRYFPGGKVVWRLNGVIPTGGYRMKFWGDGVMLVGDAARLADPASDGGIPMAMFSGKMAGEVALEALEAGDLSEKRLRAYPDRFWETFGRDYHLALKIRDFFFTLSEEDLRELHRILRKHLDGLLLATLDPWEIFRIVMRSAPDLLGFVARRGQKAIVQLIQSAL